MSTNRASEPLALSDLAACGGELRYLHVVVTLAAAAKAVHQAGGEVTLTALADRLEQPLDPSGIAPQLREILVLPRPATLAHIPETLRAIARDAAFGPRVDAALAELDLSGDGFAIDVEASLVETRDTIFDRLTAVLLDATDA